MKERISNLFKNIFGLCLFYAVGIGALVAVFYIIGFGAGGSIGEQLALWGAKIMKTAMPVAAIGSFLGLISFYMEGEHELTMDRQGDDDQSSSLIRSVS